MKIRIKGASLRLRLSRPEVAQLEQEGYLEEYTPFPIGAFRYALKREEDGTELSATFEENRITMHVPATRIEGWQKNDLVSIESYMPLNDTETLHLLLEKDFKCLDQTTEDQSENYDNPKQSC